MLSEEVIRPRLSWQQAEVAVAERPDGSHVSYVLWADARSWWPQLLDLSTGRIVACETADLARRLVAAKEALDSYTSTDPDTARR